MAIKTPSQPKAAKAKVIQPLPDQQALPLVDENQFLQISQNLREKAIGCRLTTSRMSNSKAVDKDETKEAAAALGGGDKSISATKVLTNSRHPAIKAVNAAFNRIKSFWVANSVPLASAIEGDSVEPGIRLMRRDRVQFFREQFAIYKQELAKAVATLNEAMPEVIAEAKERLGTRLFKASDYPTDVTHLFSVSFGFVSVEPPSYLAKLDPEGYEQECRKVGAQLKDTVQLAQAVFLEEFHSEIAHVSGLLSGVREVKATADGQVTKIEGNEELGWLVTIDDLNGMHKPIVQKVGGGNALNVKVGATVKAKQRIGASVNNKPKIFKDTNTRKILESVIYFKEVGSLMGCSAQVEKLVAQTEELLKRGIGQTTGGPLELTPKLANNITEKLKKPGQFREEVARTFVKLRKALNKNMVPRPRRTLGVVKGDHEVESDEADEDVAGA
jgi:Peptidase family M23